MWSVSRNPLCTMHVDGLFTTLMTITRLCISVVRHKVVSSGYADILLLKAEGLIMRSFPDLNGAANIIDEIRTKRKLSKLPTNVKGNKELMLDALLKERRMELAFEGQRWYDLVRLDKVESVMNALNVKDSGRRARLVNFTEDSYRLPIPLSVLQMNSNLVQNKGY